MPLFERHRAFIIASVAFSVLFSLNIDGEIHLKKNIGSLPS
jgi:hypothetical protein